MMTNRKHFGLWVAAGLLALASLSACRKLGTDDGDPSGGRALSFAASVRPATRSYISGSDLIDAPSGDRLPLFVTGTFYKQDGTPMELLSAQRFEHSTADGVYHASPDPVYWPVGGHADFLMFAGSASVPTSNPAVSWTGTHGADAVSFAFTDTKAADIDLVWGAANDRTNAAAAVPVTLSHAMARLSLEVRAVDIADGRLTLKSVALQTGADDRLRLAGTFSADNTLTVPAATWSGLSATADYGFFTGQQVGFSSTGLSSLVGLLDGTARQALSGSTFVPFVHMYVPEQPRKNLLITFSFDGVDMTRTLDLPAGTWEMGHDYVYRLEFVSDIRLDVSITAWENGNTLNMELQ